MYIVLLSGGSGKRLWPLSNDLRSKQYIKVTIDEETQESCSMLQRVWHQIEKANISKKTIITASKGQLEIIKGQLGSDIDVAVEPERRDTMPAVALSCIYLKDKLNAKEDECVCFLPVDPFVEIAYFERLKKLEQILNEKDADVVLMGVKPNEPSVKYGYILPEYFSNDVMPVKRFCEKPSITQAELLIKENALWNCGVFCVKIKTILKIVGQFGVSDKYDDLYKQYTKIPKISFDYQVLEAASNLYVVPFYGSWKDLGTWDVLAEQMKGNLGNCLCDSSCKNTSIINELDIPAVAVGTENLMIVSTFDGILIINKDKSSELKQVISGIDFKSKYEERQWGTLKTLDLSETKNGFTLLRKITIFENRSSSYHYHNERDEVLTILNGEGEIIVEGVSILLRQGNTLTIPRGKKHSIRAFSDMEYLETHIGKTVGDEDINRITFDWNEIEK